MTEYLDRLEAIAQALAVAPFIVTALVLLGAAIFWVAVAERHRP